MELVKKLILEDLLDLDDYSKEDQAIDEELASEDIIFED